MLNNFLFELKREKTAHRTISPFYIRQTVTIDYDQLGKAKFKVLMQYRLKLLFQLC